MMNITYGLIVDLMLTITIITVLSTFVSLIPGTGLSIGFLSGAVCSYYNKEITEFIEGR